MLLKVLASFVLCSKWLSYSSVTIVTHLHKQLCLRMGLPFHIRPCTCKHVSGQFQHHGTALLQWSYSSGYTSPQKSAESLNEEIEKEALDLSDLKPVRRASDQLKAQSNSLN